MLKKTITYEDFNGEKRTEDFFFNLTKAEIMEMEMSTEGGLAERIQKIVQTNKVPEIIKIFKDLILKAYGEKSGDGRRFIKSEEMAKEFSETEAYSELFMELSSNPDEAAKFINGIIPADVATEVAKQNANTAALPNAN